MRFSLRTALSVLTFLCSFNTVFSQAVRLPGATDVGKDAAPITVSLALAGDGALDRVLVLTQGSPNLDFSDLHSGSCLAGTAYRKNQICTVALGFHPGSPGERRGAVVLLDRAGALLAVRLVSAMANGPVATFLPGSISTVAGNQAWIFGGDGGKATQSAIFLPFGLAVDAAGNLFIADSSNNRVRKVDAVTGLISTLAGTGLLGGTGDGGPALQATLSNPSSVILDPAGNLYFSDSGNNTVRRVDAFTGVISTIAGISGRHGYSGDSGPATGSTLNTPNGLALDADGNLLIADTANNVVRSVDASTGIIRTLTGCGVAAYTGDGGKAAAACLNAPWSVALTSDGTVFIADQNNNAIRKVDRTGNISTVAGIGTAGFSGDGGLAASASLNVPASVAVDTAGNLYIADSGNNRIRKVNAHTGKITTIAGNSGESISGDSGPANQAGLYGPYTLALDGGDNLFIADVFHNRIRKISANAATLQFPPMRVGRVALPLQQALENDGNAPLNFTTLVGTSDANVDGASTTCSQTSALAPLDTCIVGAAFAPTVLGNPATGQVQVASDASNSVGVISLVGQVLDTDPSTVTITSSANPSSTGAPVDFSVLVASGGTIPTGTVDLLDGTVKIGSSTLLPGGTVSIRVTSLLGGVHNMTASYLGDVSNGAAVSPSLVQIVKDPQAATTTVLSSSAAVIDAGAPLILTATIIVTSQGSANGAVGGTVTFSEGSAVLGTASVDAASATANGGVAVLSVSTLTTGSHAISATYNGGQYDAPSSSSAVMVKVRLATTRMSIGSSANPSVAGAPVSLSATMLSTGGVPTGNVSFLDGLLVLGTAKLNGQGIATLLLNGTTLNVGSHVLTATYAGDAADGAAVSQAFTQVVNLATTGLALTSSLNPAGLGASVTLSASASSNGGIPTGTIRFLEGNTLLGSATLDANGAASLSLANLALGLHAITATYAGDAADSAATSVELDQSIQQTTTAVALTSSKSPSLYPELINLAVQVTGTGSKPVGVVTLMEGTSTLGSAALDANGAAVFPLSALAIGTHSLVASYAGDPNHAPNVSASLTQIVLQATTVALQSAAPRTIAGLPATFTAMLAGANGHTPSGLVTFSEGASVLAAMAPDASGKAIFTTATMTPGPHTVVASYPGDAMDAPSASLPVVENVDMATTAITLASSANPAQAGAALTLSAAVSGNGAMPGGTITFMDAAGGGTVLGTVAASASGTATLTLTSLSPGIHTLTAAYSGDTNDSASNSPALMQQVALSSLVSLGTSSNPAMLGDAVTMRVAVSNGVPTAPPTGSVTLTDGGKAVATLPVDASGVATFTVPAPSLGQHAMLAAYAGDSQNGPAASTPLIQQVVLRPTTATFTPSTTSLLAGQQLILFSVVQTVARGSVAPGGTVSFESGAMVLGTAPVDAAGLATLTLTPNPGNYNILAHYSGDALYAPSVSAGIVVTVGPPVAFTLAVTPPSVTLKSGEHTSMTINLVTNKNFSDTLAFGCAGLPAYATCTFSTDQLAVSGGFSHSVSVTVDTGNPLGAGGVAANGLGSGPMLCLLPGGLLLAGLARRRKVRRMVMTGLAMGLLGAATLMSGCGSSFLQRATPAGSYQFQVVATGMTSGATETAAVQMAVTK